MKKAWTLSLPGWVVGAGLTWGQALPPAPSHQQQPAADCGCSTDCKPCPCECGCDQPRPRADRFWANADYLLWWEKKGPVKPLVSTGPETLFSGALDQPGAVVLYGDGGLRYDAFSGVRFAAAWWLDAEQRLGVEAGAFALERRTTHFSAAGDANGQPFLARPFANALTGNDNVYFVSQNFADPNLSADMTGGISVSSSSRLRGWETNLVGTAYRTDSLRVRLIGGFRTVNLDEDLRINETFMNIVPGIGGATSFLGATIDPPGGVATYDSFVAHNWFYGPQLGGAIDWRRGKVSVGLTTKLALGVSQELVTIDGASTLLNNGQPVQTVAGGVLAQSSNIGRSFHNEFAVVPEVGLNLGYQITSCLQAHIGYTFLYWSDVVRPGAQIDPLINPGLVPSDASFGASGGPNRPALPFHHSDFWAQGVNFGVELRF